MRINDLAPMKGSRRPKKRVGRGPGSGHGKTSCRGHKGQNARSGGGTPPGFEGGQMPLQRRLPKRGFTNIFKKEYALINIKDLKRFEPSASIDAQLLKNTGMIKSAKKMVKLLGVGEIAHPLVIKVNKASKKAVQKIEAAGGKVEFV
jgi:large subunit ribosomal protein L15